MKATRQRVMHCPCGNAKVLALGLCATCYTLKRQDEAYFGGLREAVWSGTTTVAAFVTLRAATSVPSPCITGCLGSRF